MAKVTAWQAKVGGLQVQSQAGLQSETLSLKTT